jgi:hypothetical protein
MINYGGQDNVTELVKMATAYVEIQQEFKAVTLFTIDDFLRLYKAGSIMIIGSAKT